jgi:hypothetical protein
MSRAIPPEYAHIDEAFWEGPAWSEVALSLRAPTMVWVKPGPAAVFLRSWGEDEIAQRVAESSRSEIEAVCDAAARAIDRSRDEFGMATIGVDEAVARGAVELIEGEPRPLKRRRRRIKGIYPET